MAAHTSNIPDGMEQGLDATEYYDPPNMTFPFGAYVCVVDVDRFTGETKVRRFYALDDCGTRINPMIIEGQIHGGLTEAFAVAFGQAIPFDENGNHLGNSLMDYFLPTPWRRRIGKPISPSRRRRTIRSAPRAWPNRRMSAAFPASPMRWSTRSRIWA